MKSTVLLNFQWPLLTCLGLVLFVGIYTVVWIRAWHPANKDMYRAISELPLED